MSAYMSSADQTVTNIWHYSCLPFWRCAMFQHTVTGGLASVHFVVRLRANLVHCRWKGAGDKFLHFTSREWVGRGPTLVVAHHACNGAA
jgi:hypothetical protein